MCTHLWRFSPRLGKYGKKPTKKKDIKYLAVSKQIVYKLVILALFFDILLKYMLSFGQMFNRRKEVIT